MLAAMPLPVIANTVRYAVEMTAPSGKNATNVVHARFTGGGTPVLANWQALDAQLVKFWAGPAIGAGASVMSQVYNGCTLVQTVLTPLDGVSPSLISAHNLAGSLGGVSLPSEVAEVLTLRTARRGRRYRGRIYLLPLTTLGATAAGFLGAAYPIAFVAQMNGVMAAMAGATWELVVASYKFGSAEAVTNVTMDNRFDVQRRRK